MRPLRTWVLFLTLLVCAPAGGRAQEQADRPIVGLALGGGSAKGFAHVGVLRWLEEHRVPVDRIAGTSMGGLIAGSYASGMSPDELEALLLETDWSHVFGSSTYTFKDIGRKEDARAYPSRLEFQLRHGVTLPPSLNRGQQVELMIHRIAGLYSNVSAFDSLPTPLRTTAVDLRTGSLVIVQGGSLPRAMRATMSLPGVFPPVTLRDWILVDGGALNNLPTDVVREMGADVVIAVKVGSVVDTMVVASNLLGIVDQTVSAMVRSNTRRGAAHADILVNAAVEGFGSMDWRQVGALVEDGYRAAEAMKEQLLPLAVDESAWRHHQARREARRRTGAPMIERVEVRGAVADDEAFIRERLAGNAGRPLDLDRIETDITRLGGLDRYLTFGWAVEPRADGNALVIDAHPLVTAPPFLLASVNVRRRASDDLSFQLALRHLRYDVLVPDSELRVDLGLGSERSAAAELRVPIGSTPLFGALSAGVATSSSNLFVDDELVAKYDEVRALGQLDLGVIWSHDAESRLGLRGGWYDLERRVGDPVLPELDGWSTELRLHNVYDGQDSPVVPSRGLRVVGWGRWVLDAPESELLLDRSSSGIAQAELGGSYFWSWNRAVSRMFVAASGGTSFEFEPLVPDQFSLGEPMRLDAFAEGERVGDHYAALTVGYLHAIMRLPDFVGGPLLAGAWVEQGSAFDDPSDAEYDAQLSVGVIAETLIGPAWIGYSLGTSARGLTFGIGRLWM
jgi:NTE family protein